MTSPELSAPAKTRFPNEAVFTGTGVGTSVYLLRIHNATPDSRGILHLTTKEIPFFPV